MTAEVRQEAGAREGVILAVETSCDETSVAIVRGGKEILSNLVSSQIETHRRFGGVVPEIASRKHVEQITRMMESAVDESGLSPADIDAVAVTQGPGLVGSLLVGLVAAMGLGGAVIGPASDRLTRTIEGGGGSATEVRVAAERLLLFTRVEIVIIALVAVDMVVKPGL